eukprot:1269743-Pyramimonas_sp.AAC.1
MLSLVFKRNPRQERVDVREEGEHGRAEQKHLPPGHASRNQSTLGSRSACRGQPRGRGGRTRSRSARRPQPPRRPGGPRRGR